MKAERLPDGRIKLTIREWSEVFGPEELQSRVNFYDRMAAKYANPNYPEIAKALKDLQQPKELSENNKHGQHNE